MANDIIDINVYETVETVSITVNPNLTTVNINQVTGGGGSFTNLSTTQTASNFTINSDTGDDALVPLGNGTLAGATLNDYTTAEKNKLAGITGTNTGDQDLQDVTDIGATTTNTITANSIITTIDSTINGVRVGRGNISDPLSKNTAVGYQALQSVVHTTGDTGYYNTAIGHTALKSLTTGSANDAFGNDTLNLCTTGTYNTAIGSNALRNLTTGTQNLAVGTFALLNNITGERNVAVGVSALMNNTGSYNTAIGTRAGGNVLSTGEQNIIIGYQAGQNISSGRLNLLIECTDGGSITTGSNNIILNPRRQSGITTGSNNTIIGGFNNSLSAGLTNNVIIATGLGVVRFQSIDTGLTTVPAQTNTLINGDATGKAVVTKEYLTNSQTLFVPYTGATTDVNLGLNDITAEKLIKSGGTSSQILAANGDTITAGTNITISGGTISSTGGAGGSSSVNFYLNGSIASNVAGYQQIGATAVIGAGTDFSLVGNGTIAQFLTDVGSPNRLEIPSGAWNFELWLQSSINNSGTNIHIELYKYDGAFTLIATGVSNPISLQTNTTTNLYVTNVAIPQTTLLATDRLAIRVIASNAVGLHSVTLHTEDSNLCEVITNFVGGVTAINGITQPSQTLATGTTGTDFAINSSGSTHTFNLPSASATNRGVVTTGSQTIAGNKTFTGAIGASNLSNTNTGDNATNTQYSGLATSKQDTLQSTVNIKSINGNSILGSGDLTISGTGISSLNGLTGATQTFSINSLGSGTPSWTSSGTNHQLNIPIAGGATTTGLITGTSQPISGSKQFLSNPEIPVPAGNTTSCIVLGAAGGGGSTGTLQIGSTTLYPTALEMQYVKGITSSVQTQLDGKASIIDVAEQTYSLSPTFTGTAPTTIVANTYKWNQVGSLVTVRVNLIYSTAGSITQVVIPLPADMPTPLSPTGLTGALDILYYGTGNFNTTTTTVSGASRNCFLRRNATTGYEFVIAHTAAISSRAISLTLQYFT
jgi:hypothetical protein